MLYNIFCLRFTNFRTKLECLLYYTGKTYRWQTLWLITKIRNLRTKKFCNIGPSCRSAACRFPEWRGAH